LVHPFFGRVNVVAKPYSLSENLSELGEARFTLEFERSEDNPQPQSSGSSIQTVADKSDTMFNSLETDIDDIFNVSNAYVRNFQDAQLTLNNVVNSFNTATSNIRNDITGLNTFNSTLLAFESNIESLIAAPTAIANSLSGSLSTLYNTMRGVAATQDDFIESLSSMFDFGDTDTDLALTTLERKEREDNRTVLNNFIKCGSLADSYRAVVQIDFDTVDDIDTIQDILDTQYSAVVDGLPADSQVSLNDLRNNVRDFLDKQRISSKRVIDIETKRIPVQVLAYSLYGTVKDTEKLIELNNVKDVSFIDGDIQVLT